MKKLEEIKRDVLKKTGKNDLIEYVMRLEKWLKDSRKNTFEEFSKELKKELNTYDFWKYKLHGKIENYDWIIDEVREKIDEYYKIESEEDDGIVVYCGNPIDYGFDRLKRLSEVSHKEFVLNESLCKKAIYYILGMDDSNNFFREKYNESIEECFYMLPYINDFTIDYALLTKEDNNGTIWIFSVEEIALPKGFEKVEVKEK